MKSKLFSLLMVLCLVFPLGMLSAGTIEQPEAASPFESEAGVSANRTLDAALSATLMRDTQLYALQDGGDRLVGLQNNDGGWDWPLDDGNPDNDSPKNTVGPIAMGLAQAYWNTADANQLAALQKAGAFLTSKTVFSPSDGYLAAELDRVFGVTTYTDYVKANFYDKLAAGTYDRDGILYDTAGYVQRIRDVRSGNYANMAAWDIGMGVVGAAAAGADTTEWIAGTKAEVDELDSDNYYDVLGLAGAVYGLACVNEPFDPTSGAHEAAASVADLAAILATYQINGGGFAWNAGWVIPDDGNEAIQETAYAALALNEIDREAYLDAIMGAANYMLSVQLATGGWENYVGSSSGENNEVTGEALWGIRAAYDSVWVDGVAGLDTNEGSKVAPFATLAKGMAEIAVGGMVYVGDASYDGGLTIDKAGTTLDLGGGTIGHGSPSLTITADDVTVMNGFVDGTGDGDNSSGIVVADGVENLWLKNLEIANWPANGVEFQGSITGLKVVDCYVHDNVLDGLRFASGVDGQVFIYGNAFRNNGGSGIDGSASGMVWAQYNEWGDVAGPLGANGDGISGSVIYDPWVYGKLWVEADDTVREGEDTTVTVEMDVNSLYGTAFTLTFDPAALQLKSEPDFGDFADLSTSSWSSFNCSDLATINASGVMTVTAYRADPDTEYNAVDDVLLTLEFTAQEIVGAEQDVEIAFQTDSAEMGAKEGQRIFVDSTEGDTIKILGTTTVAGVVDLQGRDDDQGAVVDPAAGAVYAEDPAAVTTGSWGTFEFTDVTDDSYVVTIEMDRYLDASKTVDVAGDDLDLGTIKLLGGDINDDDKIDMGDIAPIGSHFGMVVDPATTTADINYDGVVNILDMVLAAGNYDLTESEWL